MGSYFPPSSGGGGGGSGLTLPTGTSGIGGGAVGIEYDGSAYALSSVGQGGQLPFDTVYSDPTAGDAPLSAPVETADYIFTTTDITCKNAGVYTAALDISFDGPLSAPVQLGFDANGAVGEPVVLAIPAGVTEMCLPVTVAKRAGAGFSVSLRAFDAGETAQVSFAGLSIVKLMAAD